MTILERIDAADRARQVEAVAGPVVFACVLALVTLLLIVLMARDWGGER